MKVNKHYKTIKTCNVSYDNIELLVITEDSGYGYTFYNEILPKLFPVINITVAGSIGNGSVFADLHKLLNENMYTHAVIIYDAGVNSDEKRILERKRRSFLSSYSGNCQIWEFKPVCFEMVLASFDYIEDMMGNQYKANEVIDILQEFRHNYSRDAIGKLEYILGTFGEKSLENLFERVMRNTTSHTRYTCNHRSSRLSKCWYNNCCFREDEYCNIVYRGRCPLSKIATLARLSTMGIFMKVVDNILGINADYLICDIDTNYIDKIWGD